MRNIKQTLKNKDGVSQILVIPFVLLVVFLAIVIGIAAQKAANEYNTLSDYANQMTAVVSREGRASGTTVLQRQNELNQAAGFSPIVSYTARWFNSSQKTVQYGDTISIRVTYRTSLSVLWMRIPLELSVTRTAQSEKYWK